eukprot:TRINITY_DN25597_c0_g1_i2.p2 TRINITY_DN25597_c0_g1~~TRINITY_DN25597_c0_g1_i2.p2  ORF type:complete len:114 (+),score=24.06 TRINITY_DN25597_c0_g1_i2:187-528(+)
MRVLAVSIPAFGHALPVLGVVEQLLDRGAEVWFATSFFFVPRLAEMTSGHSNLRWIPLRDGGISTEREAAQRLKSGVLMEGMLMSPALVSAIRRLENRPDMILTDFTLSLIHI